MAGYENLEWYKPRIGLVIACNKQPGYVHSQEAGVKPLKPSPFHQERGRVNLPVGELEVTGSHRVVCDFLGQ